MAWEKIQRVFLRVIFFSVFLVGVGYSINAGMFQATNGILIPNITAEDGIGRLAGFEIFTSTGAINLTGGYWNKTNGSTVNVGTVGDGYLSSNVFFVNGSRNMTGDFYLQNGMRISNTTTNTTFYNSSNTLLMVLESTTGRLYLKGAVIENVL